MVRFLTQVEVLKPDLSSTYKVREDECSAAEEKAHFLSLFLCSLATLDGWNDVSPAAMQWPPNHSPLSALSQIHPEVMFSQLSPYFSVHSSWYNTISHHSTCKKLSSYEWPCWPSMTLAKWEEPVPERYVGASLQWGLVSWSHQLIKYKNRHTSGSTDRRGLQRALPLFPAILKWSFPMRSLFWFLLMLDCLFQN